MIPPQLGYLDNAKDSSRVMSFLWEHSQLQFIFINLNVKHVDKRKGVEESYMRTLFAIETHMTLNQHYLNLKEV